MHYLPPGGSNPARTTLQQDFRVARQRGAQKTGLRSLRDLTELLRWVPSLHLFWRPDLFEVARDGMPVAIWWGDDCKSLLVTCDGEHYKLTGDFEPSIETSSAEECRTLIVTWVRANRYRGLVY